MSVKGKIAVAVLAVALCVAASFAAVCFYDHKMSNFNDNIELYVYPEMADSEVLGIIVGSGNAKSVRSLQRAFKEEKLADTGCKPGHYVLSKSNSSIYAARMLRLGWQSPVTLVLSGSIRSRARLAQKISAQMLMDSMDVINALGDSVLLAGYGFTTENVFALFFQDSYRMTWTDPMKIVLDQQKKEYDKFWSKENVAKAARLGLSKMDVSILASIVKGESNCVEEYPDIAQVYLNRLKKGMKLQADPTIAFCFNYEIKRILRKHLRVDSPYNTYKHKGLPPAPICVPGREAMNAVLNPGGGNNLYFCASPDFNGRHIFAASYSEHLINARAYQRALTEYLNSKAAAE